MNQKVTMYTLAEELGVSIAAISRAFNPDSKLKPEKRKLILETAARMGYEPNRMASRLSRPTLNIGIFIYSYLREYDEYTLAGIEKAHQELKDYKVNYDLFIIDDTTANFQVFLKRLEQIRPGQYDGIIMTCVEDKKVIEIVNRLNENGTKVVVLNADLRGANRLFASMPNFEMSTQLAAQLIHLCNKTDDRRVLVFAGTQKAQIEMFKEKLKRYGYHVEGVMSDLAFERSDAQIEDYNNRNLEAFFDAHPGCGALYVANANFVPVCRYLQKYDPEHKITLITTDTRKLMRTFFENGTISATIFQDPYSQGKQAFKKLYSCLANRQEAEELLLVNPQIVLQGNLSLFI